MWGNKVIGAVLNSIGNGGQNTISVPNATQTSSAPPGNGTEEMNAGNQNLAGNQAQSGQTFPVQAFQSLSQVVQIPMAAGAIPAPSLNAPIPHSLNTLSEFINHMEQTLSQYGYAPNLSSTNPGNQRVELPSNAQGLPTLEALSTVLRRAEQLLGGHAVAALSHIAGRLEREGTSSDLHMRGQIQSESMQIGLAMHHLGALLLELGRTMLTLHMGQASAESVVNAGPAVYISPSGPNPIMVQPFPHQTSSLIGGPVPSSTPATLGGTGSAPRNVNIHIHAGASLAPILSAISSRPNNGEGTRGEHRNEPGSSDSSSARVLPIRNVIAGTLPSHPPGVGVASSTQTGFGVSISQPPPDSAPLSSVRNFVGQMESTSRDLSSGSESRPALGNERLDTIGMNGFGAASTSSAGCASESGVQKPQNEAVQTCSNDDRDVLVDKFVSSSSNQDLQSCSSGETIVKSEKVHDAPSVSERQDVTVPAKAAPLGLGMSGLERKRRTRLHPPVSKGADDGSSSSSVNQSQQTITDGQRILQNLASHGSAVNSRNANGPSERPFPSSDSQIDVAGLMSQALHSPASQQTRVNSPDVLRNMLQQFTQSPQLMSAVDQMAQQLGSQDMGNMLQQFTQNPQLMNTVDQMAQQFGSQDVGSMFAGMERGQGGGIDLSRMVQQMMPIVSRAFGGGIPPSPFSAAEPEPHAPNRDGTLNRDENSDDQSLQLDLQLVAERIERLSPPTDVFRAVAEHAVELSGGGNISDDLINELCNNESLVSEYVEMLRYDASQLLKGDSEPDNS
ncbi:uncharacterized protein LOC133293734 isoform X2 [Gastrolobium bilobum]|uniref:uncharacterized protein LOC133293734 isoform X2 n=1 Tax=Gastrolobium bilobum TaxID=150636 RepID=UPI002AB2DD9A|nr:uncharacterized protein LOC133293734 isoform X2 [Gastrolobium bilobum]